MRISDWSSDVCSSDLWCVKTTSSSLNTELFLVETILGQVETISSLINTRLCRVDTTSRRSGITSCGVTTDLGRGKTSTAWHNPVLCQFPLVFVQDDSMLGCHQNGLRSDEPRVGKEGGT